MRFTILGPHTDVAIAGQVRIELMLAIGVHGDDGDAIRDVVEAGRYED
jgi:hypothetical protein